MRLAAQMRGGFYPAAPEAVAHAAQRLRTPTKANFTILDPCAGEGAALRQLGELLGCPQDVVEEYSNARRHFETYYQNCMIVPFPEDHRPYSEVVVFGSKLAKPHVDRWRTRSWESVEAPAGFVYQIPAGSGPRVFLKA